MNIKFIKSAKVLEECPPADQPEVGIVGRSNAGKSSFINALHGGRVAKVSGQPGKTRLLNFFQAGKNYRLVDMPGYGYAKVSGKEQKSWQPMIEHYLSNRKSLIGLLLIMDIRRNWSEDEQLIVDWVKKRNLPVCVILNKSDKVKQGERVKKLRLLKSIEGVDEAFVVSSFTKKGIKEPEDFIYESWIDCKIT